MSEPYASTPPRRILLASDLTSRCDRALDRALQLVRLWRAELHIVHVVAESWSGPPVGVDGNWYSQRYPTPRHEALRVMQRSLPADELGATVHLESGASPGPVIVALAERERCGLVVLGEARSRLVGPLIESTSEHVMRQAPASVLAVRDRAREPYRDLLVGTDFTSEAGQALEWVARVFPDAAISLLHAYAMPYAHLLDATPGGQDWSATLLQRVREQLGTTALPEARKAEIRCSVHAGPPSGVLRRHGIEHGPDLTVIGAHPRGVIFDAVVGNSRRIVDAVPGDLLMVRATQEAA